MKINYKYLSTFVILLLVEVFIAMFIHDNIIRPFVGDALVVSVIYFFLRSFIRKSKFLGVYIFLFACLIEVSQYFNLISLLNMGNLKIAKIIFGATFDLSDIFCYFIGTILIYVYEALAEVGG